MKMMPPSACISSKWKCLTLCLDDYVKSAYFKGDGTRSVPATMFELFDPDEDVRITEGNLPHWYQPQVTYFLTWRTADSLPADVAESWHRRRDDWLRRRGINPLSRSWKEALHCLPANQQHEYHEAFSQEYLANLDKGHGECVLRRSELADLVLQSLLHFDGNRYNLAAAVVMPNHVHVLVCLLAETDIEKQATSWKKFSATQINRVLGRLGRFWQEESFDHLVRSPASFERFRQYIAENGRAAGLHDGEWLHWQSADCPT
jgi:putative transposase